MDKEWEVKHGSLIPFEYHLKDWIFTENPIVKMGDEDRWGIHLYERVEGSVISHRFLIEVFIGRDILERIFVPDFPELIHYLGLLSPIASATLQRLEIDKRGEDSKLANAAVKPHA